MRRAIRDVREERVAWKRWVVRVHMYLGVALAFLFVMWFASGMVLAYNPYPAITPDERLLLLPRLDCTACTVSVDDALAVAGMHVAPLSRSAARLGMLGTRPVWRLTDGARRVHAVFADTAMAVPQLDSTSGADVAVAVGRARSDPGASQPAARYVRTLVVADQWTLEQPLPSQLPLLEFELADEAATHVYVSVNGAEAVTATTRRGRVMAWLGAIPHWLYPALLRRHVRAWSWLVIVIAALGTIMSLAGVAIGVWQWRVGVRRVRRDGSLRDRSPYRDPMMRWHHLLGLTFGVFTCTWMFSGMLSVNPGDWSPGTVPPRAMQERWMGSESLNPPVAGPRTAWKAAVADGLDVRELLPAQFDGKRYWLAREANGGGALISVGEPPAARVLLRVDDLVTRADVAMEGAPRARTDVLLDYDDHYRETEGRTPVLPALRIRYEDAGRTWVYVDPETATLLATIPSRTRVERWLYTGLHDLDFAFLMSHRPLWDAAVLALSLGGLLSSLAGAVLTVRWLRERTGRGRHFRRR